MPKLVSGLAAVAACLMTTVALAQNPDVPLKGRDTDPALPPSSQTPPDKIKPGPTDGGNLSDKLEKNDGVITPPGGASEGMVVKPPQTDTGSMPVIKPGDLPGQKPGTEAR